MIKSLLAVVSPQPTTSVTSVLQMIKSPKIRNVINILMKDDVPSKDTYSVVSYGGGVRYSNRK